MSSNSSQRLTLTELVTFVNEIKDLSSDDFQTAFHRVSVEFEHCCKSFDNVSLINTLVECTKSYINLISLYLTHMDGDMISKKVAVSTYMIVFNTLNSKDCLKNVLFNKISPIIHEILCDPDLTEFVGMEVLQFYNNLARNTDKTIREKIGDSYTFYIFKLVDILTASNSYEYQVLILENLFLVCTEQKLLNLSNDMFPDAESLQYGLKNFDMKHFNYSARTFLNITNQIYERVLSVIVDAIDIDGNPIYGPVDTRYQRQPLWVDFNKYSISIYCEQKSTVFCQQHGNNMMWELITVFYDDIDDHAHFKSANVNSTLVFKIFLKDKVDVIFYSTRKEEKCKVVSMVINNSKTFEGIMNTIISRINVFKNIQSHKGLPTTEFDETMSTIANRTQSFKSLNEMYQFSSPTSSLTVQSPSQDYTRLLSNQVAADSTVDDDYLTNINQRHPSNILQCTSFIKHVSIAQGYSSVSDTLLDEINMDDESSIGKNEFDETTAAVINAETSTSSIEGIIYQSEVIIITDEEDEDYLTDKKYDENLNNTATIQSELQDGIKLILDKEKTYRTPEESEEQEFQSLEQINSGINASEKEMNSDSESEEQEFQPLEKINSGINAQERKMNSGSKISMELEIKDQLNVVDDLHKNGISPALKLQSQKEIEMLEVSESDQQMTFTSINPIELEKQRMVTVGLDQEQFKGVNDLNEKISEIEKVQSLQEEVHKKKLKINESQEENAEKQEKNSTKKSNKKDKKVSKNIVIIKDETINMIDNRMVLRSRKPIKSEKVKVDYVNSGQKQSKISQDHAHEISQNDHKDHENIEKNVAAKKFAKKKSKISKLTHENAPQNDDNDSNVLENKESVIKKESKKKSKSTTLTPEKSCQIDRKESEDVENIKEKNLIKEFKKKSKITKSAVDEISKNDHINNEIMENSGTTLIQQSHKKKLKNSKATKVDSSQTGLKDSEIAENIDYRKDKKSMEYVIKTSDKKKSKTTKVTSTNLSQTDHKDYVLENIKKKDKKMGKSNKTARNESSQNDHKDYENMENVMEDVTQKESKTITKKIREKVMILKDKVYLDEIDNSSSQNIKEKSCDSRASTNSTIIRRRRRISSHHNPLNSSDDEDEQVVSEGIIEALPLIDKKSDATLMNLSDRNVEFSQPLSEASTIRERLVKLDETMKSNHSENDIINERLNDSMSSSIIGRRRRISSHHNPLNSCDEDEQEGSENIIEAIPLIDKKSDTSLINQTDRNVEFSQPLSGANNVRERLLKLDETMKSNHSENIIINERFNDSMSSSIIGKKRRISFHHNPINSCDEDEQEGSENIIEAIPLIDKKSDTILMNLSDRNGEFSQPLSGATTIRERLVKLDETMNSNHSENININKRLNDSMSSLIIGKRRRISSHHDSLNSCDGDEHEISEDIIEDIPLIEKSVVEPMNLSDRNGEFRQPLSGANNVRERLVKLDETMESNHSQNIIINERLNDSMSSSIIGRRRRISSLHNPLISSDENEEEQVSEDIIEATPPIEKSIVKRNTVTSCDNEIAQPLSGASTVPLDFNALIDQEPRHPKVDESVNMPSLKRLREDEQEQIKNGITPTEKSILPLSGVSTIALDTDQTQQSNADDHIFPILPSPKRSREDKILKCDPIREYFDPNYKMVKSYLNCMLKHVEVKPRQDPECSNTTQIEKVPHDYFNRNKQPVKPMLQLKRKGKRTLYNENYLEVNNNVKEIGAKKLKTLKPSKDSKKNVKNKTKITEEQKGNTVINNVDCEVEIAMEKMFKSQEEKKENLDEEKNGKCVKIRERTSSEDEPCQIITVTAEIHEDPEKLRKQKVTSIPKPLPIVRTTQKSKIATLKNLDEITFADKTRDITSKRNQVNRNPPNTIRNEILEVSEITKTNELKHQPDVILSQITHKENKDKRNELEISGIEHLPVESINDKCNDKDQTETLMPDQPITLIETMERTINFEPKTRNQKSKTNRSKTTKGGSKASISLRSYKRKSNLQPSRISDEMLKTTWDGVDRFLRHCEEKRKQKSLRSKTDASITVDLTTRNTFYVEEEILSPPKITRNLNETVVNENLPEPKIKILQNITIEEPMKPILMHYSTDADIWNLSPEAIRNKYAQKIKEIHLLTETVVTCINTAKKDLLILDKSVKELEKILPMLQNNIY
ncbi:repetitive organellar protein-like isoform X2 [Onthophagus taurus]|uniref:repetitive organellar protein-like isoform X2 n=1 Tax=Onthophagus taurus TaxID=166361 RepID=UPI0039BDF79C